MCSDLGSLDTIYFGFFLDLDLPPCIMIMYTVSPYCMVILGVRILQRLLRILLRTVTGFLIIL